MHVVYVEIAIKDYSIVVLLKVISLNVKLKAVINYQEPMVTVQGIIIKLENMEI
jgi:hypothetical protein